MQKTIPVFQRLAQLAEQHRNCICSKNSEWQAKSFELAERITKQFLPSGSGVDRGTTFDIDASGGEKLVFTIGFHHMNDGGYYDGWTEHVVTVLPNLAHEYSVKISGRDRNQIKDYLRDIISESLSADCSACQF